METAPCSWVRAEYHLPTLSSCRVPMTSITSARALPTPGPATVRLALIRTGIEVFGIPYMESVLFPLITALPLHIRPPERVALAPHVLHAYKIDDKTQQQSCAPISREMAHAEGPLTIYLHLPIAMQDRFRQLLQMVGYWGQASSLACCTGIEQSQPPLDECATPLHLFKNHAPLRPFFSSLLSEFRATTLSWHDVMPLLGNTSPNPLRMEIYVWPLVTVMHHGSGRLLLRQPFTHPVPQDAAPPTEPGDLAAHHPRSL
jgi:hypothetical protein